MARQPIAHPATPENVHEFIKSALGAPDTMRALIEAMKEVQSQEKSVDTDKAVIKAFERAGYESVVLFDRSKTLAEQASSVTVLTYKKWSERREEGRALDQGSGLPHSPIPFGSNGTCIVSRQVASGLASPHRQAQGKGQGNPHPAISLKSPGIAAGPERPRQSFTP